MESNCASNGSSVGRQLLVGDSFGKSSSGFAASSFSHRASFVTDVCSPMSSKFEARAERMAPILETNGTFSSSNDDSKSRSSSPTSPATTSDDCGVTLKVKTAILEAWRILRDANDLSPKNPSVNKVLRVLVGTIVKCDSQLQEDEEKDNGANVMKDPEIRLILFPLWKLLSTAEAEMENWWANRIIDGQEKSLDAFWYRDNYRELTQLELKHLAGKANDAPITKNSRCCFVGSGPLPITAIDMHLQAGAKIKCIDIDEGAVNRSRKLIQCLNLDDAITVSMVDGKLGKYDGVTHAIIAALVPNQVGVAARILKYSPKAVIGVRSANGLRTVLYPAANIKEMVNLGLRCTGSSPINERVINTLVAFRLEDDKSQTDSEM